jgi:hypothetical protein
MSLPPPQPSSGDDALLDAVKSGDAGAVERLLQSGTHDMHCRAPRTLNSALHLAAAGLGPSQVSLSRHAV